MKSILWIAVFVIVALVAWFLLHQEQAPRIDFTAPSGPPVIHPEAGAARIDSADEQPGTPDRSPITAIPRAEPDKPPLDTPARGAGGHLVLRLLDDTTHEPVPRLRVNVRGATGEQTLESDDDGLVACTRIGALEPVTLDLLSSDRHHSDRVQTHAEAALAITTINLPAAAAASATPRDVEVSVGPTYFLGAPLPRNLDAGAFTAQLSSADPRQAFDKLFATLQPGERLWMRFSAKARAMSGGPPWSVHLGSSDGLWSGMCEVASIVGIQRNPLTIVFESTGRLQGTVTDARRTSLVAAVQLWAPGASFQDPKNRPRIVIADSQGHFDARWLPAGAYTLKVEVDHHPAFEQAVAVVAGTSSQLDIQLGPELAKGNLKVRMTSETGTYAGKVQVMARSQGKARALVSQPIAWNPPADGGHGQAEFTDLEIAPHLLRVLVEDGTPTSPASVTEPADGRTVEFRVLDRTPMRDLVFEVRDVQSGEALVFETLRVSVAQAPPDGPRPVVVKKDAMRARLPAAPSYAVELRAKGYCPLRIEIEPPAEGQPIVLRPKKGWGIQVHAVDDADHDLAGVRILLDGRDAGATDARGLLDVELDTEPKALKATRDGWRMSKKGDVDIDTGQFRTWQPWVRVVMERAPN